MLRHKMKFVGLPLALAGAVLMGSGTESNAAETIKLTIASAGSPKAPFNQLLTKFFIPEVDKRLAAGGKYKVRWNKALTGALAKAPNLFEAVEEGIADLGLTIMVFENAKLPLHMVSFATPFAVNNCTTLNKVFHQMQSDIPEMKAAWQKQNHVFLGAIAQDTYNIWSKKPIQSVADLKGLKVGAGNANSAWLQNTGAVHVSSTLPKMYNEMSTGVFDAALMSTSFGGAFKFGEVAPYLVKAGVGATNSGSLTMNKSVFNRLPADVQKVMVDVGTQLSATGAKTSCGAAKFFEGLAVKAGAKVIEFPLAERKNWAAKLPNLAGNWADSLESKGLPGRKVLGWYMTELRKSGENVLRNWDQ